MAKQQLETGPYRHKVAPFASVNGGAEELAFLRPSTLPLISWRGPARIAGEFLPFGSGPTRIELHPTGAPQPQPFLNNDYYIQDSDELEPDGSVGAV